MAENKGKPTIVTAQLSTSETVELCKPFLMETAQEAKLLSALESADFDTALQLIHTPSLVRLGPNRLTLLHYACQHGRLDIIRSLVTQYPHDVKLLGEGTCSPLHIATKYGQLECAQYLVENKLFSKAAVSTCGTNTPLHIGAEEGHINMVALLIEENICDASAVNGDGNTPLHVAAACGQLSIIHYFIARTHCNPASKNSQNGKTALHLSAENGHLDIVKYLIEEQNCDPSCRDEEGKTPLYFAAGKDQIHVVQFLIIEKHCDPMSTTTTGKNGVAAGRTALHIASSKGYLSIVQYLVTEQHCTPLCTDNKGITPLHLASQEGHLDVVVFLSENVSSNNPTIADSDGNTHLHTAAKRDQTGQIPLHFAAEHGHLDIVMYLIDKQHCDPSCTDEEGKTPLYLAAGNGKLQVVEYLTAKKKCNPMCATTKYFKTKYITIAPGRTPLHAASYKGHLSVVQYLIDHCGCNPSCSDDDGFTPLHSASTGGHLNIVKFLVEENQCDPKCKSTGRVPSRAPGRIPLHGASYNGYFDIVHYLVDEQKCDPLISDEDGYTPLHLASQEGHLSIVQYFVKKQPSVLACSTTSNPAGRTPLHSAALKGQTKVIKFLIDKMSELMCPDEYNNTPLHFAATNGHTETVRFLVEEKQCDPMCRTKTGKTPLHLASQNGHLEVVKYLTEDKCDPMCYQDDQWCPLHLAALNGHNRIVKFLVEEKQCDPMCRSKTGMTPLHLASRNGHLEVVKYLTEDKCDPMCYQDDQWCPLHLAALNGHNRIVKFLVEEKQCDPMCRSKTGMTPLHLASRNGHLEVVKYLTEDKCDPMCYQDDQWCSLHFAASNGHNRIVKFLVEEKQCDPMCRTKTGVTPLHLASRNGHLEVVKYLTEDKCDPMCYQDDQWCSLHFAASNGHNRIVKFLVEEKQCDPMCRSKTGMTPLHLASQNGHLEVVKYLTEYKCDPMCRSKTGMTPLHLASRNGHLEVVKIFVNIKQYEVACGDNLGVTALQYASLGSIEVVKYLVENAKCDPMFSGNIFCLYPLHLAAVAGNTEIVRFLVDKQQHHVKDTMGHTPLHYAVIMLGKNTIRKMYEEVPGHENLLSTMSTVMVQTFLKPLPGCHNAVQMVDSIEVNAENILQIVHILINKGKYDPLEKNIVGFSALHYAMLGGHLEVVKVLATSETFNPLCPDISGASPLHLAVQFGHTEIIKFLVSKSINSSLKGNTAIHTAAYMGQLDTVKCLLSTTSPLQCKNEYGQNPLHCALMGWYLCTNKSEQNAIDGNIISTMAQAIQKCQNTQVGEIVGNVFSSTDNIASVMHVLEYHGILSYQQNYLEIINFLLNEGNYHPFKYGDKGGTTPFHYAACLGNLEVVVLFTRMDSSDPACTDNNGITALHLACGKGHYDIVHYLLSETDVDPMCQALKGITPLHVAAVMGHSDIVDFLLKEKNCNPTCNTLFGMGPLHMASHMGHYSVVRSFLENYHVPITKDDFGSNPLSMALLGLALKHVVTSKELSADLSKLSIKLISFTMDTSDINSSQLQERYDKGSHIEVVRLLLNAPYCDPAVIVNSKDMHGQTPVHLACYLGEMEVLKLFSQIKCIDPMIADNDGLSPLHYAITGRDHLETGSHDWDNYVDEISTELIQMSDDLENVGTEDIKQLTGKICSLLLKHSKSRNYLAICNFLMKECHFNPVICTDKDGDTPLHYAAWMNDAEAFKLLASAGTFDPLCPNKDGITTLHIASGNGNTAIVNFLINDCRVQPIYRCKDGTTPLHWASEKGQLDIIEVLAYKMPHNFLDQKDSSGRSPLHYAAASGQLSVLQCFIDELNCDPFCKDRDGNTILHSASVHGSTAVVRYLITTWTTKWNTCYKNKLGQTPVYFAAWKGHLDIVQLLTSHIPINLVIEMSNTSPLHIAAGEGYKDIVVWLARQRGYNVNCPTKDGLTALHEACINGHLDIVIFLIDDQNCNPLCVNSDGATPLHFAVVYGHADIVQFLCNRKSYSQYCNTLYGTPLHLACSSNLEENLTMKIVQILLDQPCCDPSNIFNGSSPLHLAADTGHFNLVKFLINEKGCDPLQPDSNGKLTLHHAVKGQNADIVDFLVCCKPESIMHEDHMGVTSLMCATSENIVMKFLLNGADPCDIKIKLSEKMSYLNNYAHLTGRSNVYIIGNHRSGKTTLVGALESEHKWFLKKLAKVTVSKDIAVGIKHFIYEESKYFGPVVFHDFAGEVENYCGHPALLENCKGSAKPVFIIVTNLSDPLDDIKKQIGYWLHWISNLCTAVECYSSVIIVGSHSDSLKSQDFREKDLYLQNLPVSDEIVSSHTTVLGSTTLNCQRSLSTGMSKLREMLKKACKLTQTFTNIHSMLLAFTKHTFSSPIQLESVQEYITENEIPLPHLLEVLNKLYQDLDFSGHVMLLKNENDPEKSWVALDQKRILHLVNNFLCYAREHSQYKSTGIVSFSELAAWFGDHFHPEFIREYLVHIEVCQQTTGFVHLESYNFFPTLLDAMPHEGLWNLDPNYNQYFGWCLRTKPNKFFPVKFLHALLLEFACTFASPSPKHVGKVVSRDCYIWKNGIRWFHMDSGTEVVVHFCEQNTTATVMTRCKKGHEMKYYRHRSAVLKRFIDTSEKFHLKSVTREYIFHPDDVSKYRFSQPKPTSSFKQFNVHGIASNLIRQLSLLVEDKAEQSALSRGIELPDTEVQDILHFEPFLGIQKKTLEALFNKATENITAPFLWSLINDMHTRWQNLNVIAEIFGCRNRHVLPVISELESSTIMKEVLDRKEKIGGLCHKLHEYSIFCGRNVLEIADSLHELSDSATEPNQADDIINDETEAKVKVNGPAEVPTPSLGSKSHARPVSPIWRLANSTLLDLYELSHIRNELIHVTEWFPLGLALGLDFSTLEKIRINNQGLVDDCMREMLIAWLKHKDNVVEKPSWRTLAEALSQPIVNKVALARRIATTYTSHSPETLALLDY